MICINYQEHLDWIVKWLKWGIDHHIDLILVGLGLIVISTFCVRSISRFIKRRKTPRKRSPFDGIVKRDIPFEDEPGEIIFNPGDYDNYQAGPGHTVDFSVHAPGSRPKPKPKRKFFKKRGD